MIALLTFSCKTLVPKRKLYTVKPQLSEANGRHTIGSDNRGVQIGEGNPNLPSMGYQVGDN